MSALDVYLHERRVGTLERVEQGRLRFSYADHAVADASGSALSLSLPVRPEPFEDEQCRPFFAGLLPEGGFLRAVARAFGVSASNPFAVLDAIGGECAGAVSLVPPNARPPEAGTPRWLGPGQLADLLTSLPGRPLLAGDGEGIRLSLAGAQEKLPVLFDGERVGITRGAPPSTHIMKLPIEGFQATVANEACNLALARAAGLSAVKGEARTASVAQGAAHDYLLVERYDRTPEPVRRIHQEDICQALGTVPELKYEGDGGPGVAHCADLIGRHCAVPARDRLAFADSLIFNLIIGNHDAHSKNLSLLLEGPDTPRLAPLYDLIATSIYEGLSPKPAMRIGGENRPGYVRGRHLDRLASELGMRPAPLRRRAADLADRVEEVAGIAAEQLDQRFATDPVLDRIREQLGAGLKRLRGAIAESPGP